MKNLIFSLLFILSASLYSQNTQQIDSLFLSYQNQPGCCVGIMKGDSIHYIKGFGLSNLDYQIPISPETVFDIGSVSKQFTAACIHLLANQGKLKLDDDISQYFPEIPLLNEHKITIRNLLHHSSGLRDYLLLELFAGGSFNREFAEEDGLEIMTRQKNLNFEPGSRYEYSNSGYMLLAIIIRRVSGISIGQFAEENIFQALSMENTLILEDGALVIPNRAIGYDIAENEFKRLHHYDFTIGGDGQVYTTVGDFMKWQSNLIKGDAFFNGFKEAMCQRGILNNGDTLNYASGLILEKYKGLETISHTGAWGGSRAYYLHIPSEELTIAIFSNLAYMEHSLIYKVADMFLEIEEKNPTKEQFEVAPPLTQTISVNLRPYPGVYRLEEGVELNIEIKNDSLYVHQSWDNIEYCILPQGDHRFISKDLPDLLFYFENIEENLANKLSSSYLNNQIVFYREGFQSKESSNLSGLIGDYWSEELNCKYHILIANSGQLKIKVRNRPQITLRETVPGTFVGLGMKIHLSMDDGDLNGFFMDSGSVKGIEFKKMD